MYEKYKKEVNNLKINLKEDELFDPVTYEFKRSMNLEKLLRNKLKQFKEGIKHHNVFKAPKLDRLRSKIMHDITIKQEHLESIKWYHRGKTRLRNFFKGEIRKLTELIEKIDRVKARLKKRFDEKLKNDPDYYKKEYQKAIKLTETFLKKIPQLQKRILSTAKKQEDITIFFYKHYLDYLQGKKK